MGNKWVGDFMLMPYYIDDLRNWIIFVPFIVCASFWGLLIYELVFRLSNVIFMLECVIEYMVYIDYGL